MQSQASLTIRPSGLRQSSLGRTISWIIGHNKILKLRESRKVVFEFREIQNLNDPSNEIEIVETPPLPKKGKAYNSNYSLTAMDPKQRLGPDGSGA